MYNYSYNLENKTHIGTLVSEKMMSEKEFQMKEEATYLNELDSFDNDEDF